MKLEVYEKSKKDSIVRVGIEEERDGDILLSTVDEAGKNLTCGGILRINSDGSITRCNGVNTDFGFRLDSKGRVELDE